jgi:CRP-like cAMP-binding protein
MINLELFRDAGDAREVKAGATIFHEGEEGQMMYVLLEGSVKLSVMGRQLEKLNRGGVFGEMSLIDSSPRSASATAITDVKLVPVSAERFRSLIRKEPEFALEIMSIMAARLRSMDRRI